MTAAETKRLLGHVLVASALLTAVSTGANLRLELGGSLTTAELSELQSFWQRQLVDAISELERARRLTAAKGKDAGRG